MSILDIQVTGFIKKVTEEENTVTVYGRLEFVLLYNQISDYDTIVKLYNLRGYVKLIGQNLVITEKTEDLVKLKGNLTKIIILDEKGNELYRFNVESCAIKIEQEETDLEE